MSKKICLLILLTTLLYADTFKYVEFKGDKYFNTDELYEALGLKTPPWYLFYKDKRAKVDEKIIDSLYDILKNFYKTEGFYHALIKKIDENQTVVFDINSSKPIIIKRIESDMPKKYNHLINQKKGERFIASKFIDAKKNIKKRLLEDSYCNANLDTKAYIDIDKNITTLKYHLQTNNPCHFQDIIVSTPKDISKKVVLSRLNFHKGSLYNSKKITQAYSSISGLEVFSMIGIKQNISNEDVNVKIDLQKRKKMIRQEIGVGYETNLGPKALFRWEQRNFHGDAKKVSVDLKYSKKEKFIKNSFFWPAFIKAPFFDKYYLDLKNQFSYSKMEYDKFREEKIANYLHLLKDYYNFSIDSGLGFERIDIKKSGDICNINDGQFFLLYPFLKLIIDTRDSKINPKNGIYLSTYFESGIKFLGSNTSYTKSLSEARVVKSFNNLTLAIKSKFGFITELQGELPESKKFFAGGAFSNRAYGYNRLGATNSKCEDMGGKTIFDSSIEADYWINPKYGIALFYDTTMLTIDSLEFNTDFKSSVGFGIRYMTALGPIKLDYGVDIKDHSIRALHFQIGQSF